MQIIRDPEVFWKMINECTSKPDLFLYGNGKLVRQFADYLSKYKVQVAGIILSEKIECEYYCGYKAFPPKDLANSSCFILAIEKPRHKIKNAVVLFDDKNQLSFLVSPVRKSIVGQVSYSIITNNCSGGIMYGLLDSPYLSPTIGTAIDYCDYVKLASDPHYYFSLHPTLLYYETSHTDYHYPVCKLGDITIRFVHYKTLEEALEKWERRANRLNYDNLLFFLDESGETLGFREEQLFLSNVKGKKLVIHRKSYYGAPNTIFTTSNFFDKKQLIDSWFDIIEITKCV